MIGQLSNWKSVKAKNGIKSNIANSTVSSVDIHNKGPLEGPHKRKQKPRKLPPSVEEGVKMLRIRSSLKMKLQITPNDPSKAK